MSKRILGLVAVGSLLLAIPAALASDDNAKTAKDAAMPSHDEMMAAWMKLASPGEQHATLKALAGSWKTVVKSWEGPGEPKVSEGSCETTMLMDGRYLKEDFTGDVDGMPFQGMGLTGYDNSKKKFVGSWVDNMGTGIMVSEGTMDPAKKVITFRSKSLDPMNPASGKMVPVRMTTKIVDNNTHIFTMYTMMAGKETKQMEITYTRK